MPACKRHKTKYQDVFYIQTKAGKKFYIRYYHPVTRRRVEEAVGLAPGMTAARANQVRLRRIYGGGSNRERRPAQSEDNSGEKEKYSINRIWDIYRDQKHYYRAKYSEANMYDKHIRHSVGRKRPSELAPLDIDRVRIKLQKAGKLRTAAYADHALNCQR